MLEYCGMQPEKNFYSQGSQHSQILWYSRTLGKLWKLIIKDNGVLIRLFSKVLLNLEKGNDGIYK